MIVCEGTAQAVCRELSADFSDFATQNNNAARPPFGVPMMLAEDAMNPFLARYSSVQLRYVRGSRRCVRHFRCTRPSSFCDFVCEFTAIGRKGTSFCSVPMAELHARGLGNAAHGRSARLGGDCTLL
eukprot:s5614_g3.t1